MVCGIVKVSSRGILRDAARWLFLATLVCAPWFYGGTTEEAIGLINGLLAGTLVLWAADLLRRRRWPVIPGWLAITVLLICLLGWLSVFNAVAVFDSEFEMFAATTQTSSFWPASFDAIISSAWMVRAMLLLGCCCFVAELSQNPKWLLRLWYAIGIAGASIALLGLLQKATGARAAFWGMEDGTPWQPTFFATFYYHANAGAYLNLVLAPIAGLAWRAVQRLEAPWQRALWCSALVLGVIAMLSNTSRMSQLLGLAMLACLSTRVGPGLRRVIAGASPAAVIAAILVVALNIYLLARISHLDRPIERWKEVTSDIAESGRWAAIKVATKSLADVGLFGFGPGTFRVVFPHYEPLAGPEHEHGGWDHLHQDYLQTLMEWGWLGASLWAFLFLGAIVIAIRSLRRDSVPLLYPRQRQVLMLLLVALGAVAIHALVDFPLQILSIQLYVAAYLGICWGSSRWGHSSVFPPRRTESADASRKQNCQKG